MDFYKDLPANVTLSVPRPRLTRRDREHQLTGLEVAIVDLGAGIPATLARNPAHAGLTDLAAVVRSLEPGVSSLADAGPGGGLPELVGDIARSRNATLIVASGHARLHLTWTGGKRRQYESAPPSPVRGTWIAVRFQLPTAEAHQPRPAA